MMHEAISPPATAAPRRPGLGFVLLACWIFACAVMIMLNWQDIVHLNSPDPDDQLRLVEVRDWLAGQSWWDVSQHRMNPPIGGAMHWSRLVDLPLAAVIVLFVPFLGYATAQTVAAVAVPLVTLGFAMAMAALLCRRLIGREAAIVAALLVCATPGALQQMRPMRVDHHGWQIGLAVAVIVALLGKRPFRAGLIGGALAALWLRISLEGLPLAAAAGALVGLRWAFARDHEEDARLTGFFGALLAGSVLLFALFIPTPQWPIAWCDAISVQHLAMFGCAFAGSLLLRLIPPRPLARLAAGGALAALCLAVFHAGAPRCGVDAFADLDPLVRKVWYNNVLEGLPLWRQDATIATLAIGYPLIALAGGLVAWWRGEGEARTLWLCYLFLLGCAIVAAILVQRIGGTANMIALPGGLYLMQGALRRARAQTNMLKRLLGTAGAVLLLAPVTPALAVVLLLPADKAKTAEDASSGLCATTDNFRKLNAVPAAAMLAPLDLGPGILLNTPHRVVASGYHRNSAAIGDVIRAYIGSDDQAHAIIARRGVRYVVLCRHAIEVIVYRHYGPNGFASHLIADRPPAWLQPVPLGDAARMRLWRVVG